MASVSELTEPYGNFMLGPERGAGVCDVCCTFTDGYSRCYTCARTPQALDAVLPISYSVATEQLHYVLAAYKRLSGRTGRLLSVQLAAVLWRFLLEHERCLARAAGIDGFDVVTTVPSGDGRRDAVHPLRRIVSEIVGPSLDRHQRLLSRSEVATGAHEFHQRKYVAAREVAGPVLLIDDTWTTGANAQSAAAALKAAGAGPVAAIVIGRHVNPEWGENGRRLGLLRRPFDWSRCAFCGAASEARNGLP